MSGGAPEIFASVQGEGVTSGLPSVFVRLSRCNLKCTFCDTRYTWDWSRYDRSEQQMTLPVDRIAAEVTERAGGVIGNVVLTGGEPLLQQRELADLARRLRGGGFRIEIETNGTLEPDEALAASIDQWNVSPKLESSGNPERARVVPGALRWFAACPHAWLKLVITRPEDVAEAAELAERAGVPAERVILMPEGTDAATLVSRSRWLAEHCQRRGFRLGSRLHIHLWGDERGR